MSFSPLINQLVDSLSCLPGVGKKSALRMAFHLLERDRNGGLRLSEALEEAMTKVKRCRQCRTFSESDLCSVCTHPQRNSKVICVVESPTDMQALENLGAYKGLYFVLMGRLSPIEGLGPDEIGIPDMVELVRRLGCEEVVVATNPTMEGEATAHFIAEVFDDDAVVVTRLAHGMPTGGELGYLDSATLSYAFAGRKPFK